MLPTDVGPSSADHPAAHNVLHLVYNAPAQIVAQTGSYTLVLADANKVVEIDSASPSTLTIPADASVAYPIGVVIGVCQLGTGLVTVAPDSGVTILSSVGQSGSRDLAGRYAEASLRKRATNTWILVGDLG